MRLFGEKEKIKEEKAPEDPKLFWQFRCILIDRPGEFCIWDPETDRSAGTIVCSPSRSGSGKPGDPFCKPASTQYVINYALKQFEEWEIQSFWVEPLPSRQFMNPDNSRHQPKAEIWLKRRYYNQQQVTYCDS